MTSGKNGTSTRAAALARLALYASDPRMVDKLNSKKYPRTIPKHIIIVMEHEPTVGKKHLVAIPKSVPTAPLGRAQCNSKRCNW